MSDAPRDEINREVIDLTDAGSEIRGARFHQCIIRGTGKLKFQDRNTIMYCAVPNSIPGRHFEALPEDANKPLPEGTVVAFDCLFEECLFDIKLIGTEQDKRNLVKALAPMSEKGWRAKYGVA